MQTTDNTILITGGGSRASVAPWRRLFMPWVIRSSSPGGGTLKNLDETTAANPGMKSLTVDMTDPASIREFARPAD